MAPTFKILYLFEQVQEIGEIFSEYLELGERSSGIYFRSSKRSFLNNTDLIEYLTNNPANNKLYLQKILRAINIAHELYKDKVENLSISKIDDSGGYHSYFRGNRRVLTTNLFFECYDIGHSGWWPMHCDVNEINEFFGLDNWKYYAIEDFPKVLDELKDTILEFYPDLLNTNEQTRISSKRKPSFKVLAKFALYASFSGLVERKHHEEDIETYCRRVCALFGYQSGENMRQHYNRPTTKYEKNQILNFVKTLQPEARAKIEDYISKYEW